jgi:RNA polymerase sigma-70 factor (ECF subfamily)
VNDKQLIEKILAHNDQAFSILVEKHKKMVYGTIFRIVRNKSDAEDLFQEVFLKVYSSAYQLRNLEDLSGWLFKIAYNKSISFLRKKNPAKANPEQAKKSPLQMVLAHINYAEKETQDWKMEQDEARVMLFSAIDRLPEMQKKVLLMHKFEDYSHNEICLKLNLSQAAVESLIYRAMFSLRKFCYAHFTKHLK